jgi:hypothetical protein
MAILQDKTILHLNFLTERDDGCTMASIIIYTYYNSPKNFNKGIFNVVSRYKFWPSGMTDVTKNSIVLKDNSQIIWDRTKRRWTL